MESISESRRLQHEIRNQLNALNLNASCLKLCEHHEVLQCVESIIQASTAVNDLIEEIERLPESPSEYDATARL